MFESDEDVSQDALREDKIVLEIGYNLIPMVQDGGSLPDRIGNLRREIAREIGLPAARIRVRDNMELAPYEYRILFMGEPVAGAHLPGTEILAVNTANPDDAVRGKEYTEPVYSLRGTLADAGEREKLEGEGYMVLDSETILVTHLTKLIKEQAANLLGRAEAVRLLKATRGKFPGLVNEFLKSWQAGELRAVLALMLEEGLSIGYMPIVLEVFAENARGKNRGDEFSAEEIYGGIRGRLKNVLCADITEEGHMSVFATNEAPSEDENTREALRMSMRACVAEAARRDIFPIVLTPGVIRLQVFRALAAGIDPSLFKVLCRGDIPYGIEIDIIGRLSPADAPPPEGDGTRTYEEGRHEGFLDGLKQGLGLKRWAGSN